MFFDTWGGIGRVLILGALAYGGLVAWLRISGKRTLAKWNAFDLVVTIALGSTLATIMLSRTTALAEGLVALGLLVALQFVITWSSVRLAAVNRVVKAQPTLLLYRGRLRHAELQAQRVTAAEVRAAVRSAGLASLDDVEAVVLETDGSVSVVKRSSSEPSALRDVLPADGDRGDHPPARDRPDRRGGR